MNRSPGPYTIRIITLEGPAPAWKLVTRARCLIAAVTMARALRGMTAVFLGQTKLWPTITTPSDAPGAEPGLWPSTLDSATTDRKTDRKTASTPKEERSRCPR